ncbi:hypothetical protein [Streptomyces sp. IBSBF 3136]|uniref:hypothetical protein n=1 Tax=Streptomyces sp. IBSBF 3136 TaxID=2903524 RepID=UPI002FDC4885
MGAVVAAAAAGVFSIIGILAGLYVGRRQTVDQASVEHAQWLRNQRQEAYLQLVDAWEAALDDLRAHQNAWDDRVQEHGRVRAQDAPWARVAEGTERVWAVLRPKMERVELLGVPRGTEAFAALYEAWRDLDDHFDAQAGQEPSAADWEAWSRVVARAIVARQNFLVAASQALRTPPSPQGE